MAPAVNLRQVLVEIPNPQPKIAVHLRRSYEDVLNSPSLRANIPTSHLRRESIPSNDYPLFPNVEVVAPESMPGTSPVSRRGFAGEERNSHFNSPTASSDQTRTWQSGKPKEMPMKKRRINVKHDVNFEPKVNDSLSSQLVSTPLLHRHPELHQNLKLVLPSLILKILEEQLELNKSNVYRSIPRWRLGSNRDAYCFRKAHAHLQAFKKTCLEQGRLLLQSECWETTTDYILIAWKYTSELPHWDNSFHNECTQQCFTTLAVQSMIGLQRSCLELEKYKQLKKRFQTACTQNKLMKPCFQQLERMVKDLERGGSKTESISFSF